MQHYVAFTDKTHLDDSDVNHFTASKTIMDLRKIKSNKLNGVRRISINTVILYYVYHRRAYRYLENQSQCTRLCNINWHI